MRCGSGRIYAASSGPSGSVDTYASLTDSSEDQIAFDDGDDNFRMEHTLDAGIYYVKVGGHGVGAYRVLGSMTPSAAGPPPPDDPDDGGDAIAVEISECNGRLVGDDVDVTIRGTVSANRSVTDLEISAYANDHLIDTESIGSRQAGDSDRFDFRGSYPFDGNTRLTCSIEATFRTQGGGGGNAPDLVVERASVSDSTPAAGASFSVGATVRNAGDGRADATTLRY